jgi:hypothetical protein
MLRGRNGYVQQAVVVGVGVFVYREVFTNIEVGVSCG